MKRETILLPHEKKNWQNRLMSQLVHCTWFGVINGFDETHLVITEDFLIKRLRNLRKKSKGCGLATPDDFENAISSKINTILVFCIEGELTIVRTLQKKYPNIKVTSGSYGFNIYGRDRLPKLNVFHAAKQRRFAKPRLILATTNADAEFVANSMAENGLPYFHEFMGRHYGTWVRRSKYFQVARFYDAMDRLYSSDGHTDYLLQTDVLNSMIANTSFSLNRFIRYLEKAQAKIILVRRHNKLVQAVSGQLMSRSQERSVWTNKPSKKLTVKFRPDDINGSIKRQRDLANDENTLAKVAASGAATMEVYLEDYIENQSEGLANIASFLDEKPKDPAVMLDYDQGYALAPDLAQAPLEYKRQLMDRLGLHIRPLI